MAFINPTTPNITDFLQFLSESVQIPVSALPEDSPWPQYSLTQAIILTPTAPGMGILYPLATYNCATHLLFVITPDQANSNYFATARANQGPGFALIAPSTGLVAAGADQGTSSTLASPKWATGLTVTQLGYYKTPWGREYLGYIQSSGPTIVALS